MDDRAKREMFSPAGTAEEALVRVRACDRGSDQTLDGLKRNFARRFIGAKPRYDGHLQYLKNILI